MNWIPKIGDWIRPVEPCQDGINYGYNKRLIIEISEIGDEFTTVCSSFGIEENIWDLSNSIFIGRLVLEDDV